MSMELDVQRSPQVGETVVMRISDIIVPEGINQRFYLDTEKIEQYAEDLDSLPPLKVQQLSDCPTGLYLTDGFIRREAFIHARREYAKVTISPTTSTEIARANWLRINSKQGQSLTNAEVAKCVSDLLEENKTPFEIRDLLPVSVATVKMHQQAKQLRDLCRPILGDIKINPSFAPEILRAPQKYWIPLVQSYLQREKLGRPFTIHGRKEDRTNLRALVTNLNDPNILDEYRDRLINGEIEPITEAMKAIMLRRENEAPDGLLLGLEQYLTIVINAFPVEKFKFNASPERLESLRETAPKFIAFLNEVTSTESSVYKLRKVQ